jgi:hypothetical protein
MFVGYDVTFVTREITPAMCVLGQIPDHMNLERPKIFPLSAYFLLFNDESQSFYRERASVAVFCR